MDNITNSDRKLKEKYKKREEVNLLQLTQNIILTNEKEKNNETNIEDYKDLKTEIKNEKDGKDKSINLTNIKKHMKNNKSYNYFLSDSETTVGDTMTDNINK